MYGMIHSRDPEATPFDAATSPVEGLFTDDLLRDRASFENLFRNTPIPMMEQDYTELEVWMEGLRHRGVTDVIDHIGGDLGTIRSLVHKITITAANPAALRAIGLPLTEALGPLDPRIVNEGALPGWHSQFRAVWNRTPVSRASFVAATTSGRIYDAESVLSAPIVNGLPDFSRAVFSVIDVTGHRNEERRMQELVEAKNRFLASVSHEIRTPLTAVVGFSEMLETETSLDEEDRTGMISSIARHARDLADLVEDLLVAARAEMGQLEVGADVVDVRGLIREILDNGGAFTANVVDDCPTGDASAIGDAVRIRQILRNLLTNAKRYGGPNVSISLTCDLQRVSVEVSDDGAGLPLSEWERIFEPYARAHSRPGAAESVGIGLAISRGLAEAMGGTLVYRFRRGRSVFALTLPATPPMAR